jgi:hypothetical protein
MDSFNQISSSLSQLDIDPSSVAPDRPLPPLPFTRDMTSMMNADTVSSINYHSYFPTTPRRQPSSEARTRRKSRSYPGSHTPSWLRRPCWECPFSTKDDDATDSETDEDDYAWYYNHPDRYICRPRRTRQARGPSQRPSSTATLPSLPAFRPHAFHALASADAPFFKVNDSKVHSLQLERLERDDDDASTRTPPSRSSSVSSGSSKMFLDLTSGSAGASTPESVDSFSLVDGSQLSLPSPSLNAKRYGTLSPGSDWVGLLPKSPLTSPSFSTY